MVPAPGPEHARPMDLGVSECLSHSWNRVLQVMMELIGQPSLDYRRFSSGHPILGPACRSWFCPFDIVILKVGEGGGIHATSNSRNFVYWILRPCAAVPGSWKGQQ